MYLGSGCFLIGFLKSSIFGFVEFLNCGTLLLPSYSFLCKPWRSSPKQKQPQFLLEHEVFLPVLEMTLQKIVASRHELQTSLEGTEDASASPTPCMLLHRQVPQNNLKHKTLKGSLFMLGYQA